MCDCIIIRTSSSPYHSQLIPPSPFLFNPQFDIANFELFSNLPKEIQVSGSHRYPSRDWSSLGRFTAQEGNRGVQSFHVDTEDFYKYVKVRMARGRDPRVVLGGPGGLGGSGDGGDVGKGEGFEGKGVWEYTFLFF